MDLLTQLNWGVWGDGVKSPKSVCVRKTNLVASGCTWAAEAVFTWWAPRVPDTVFPSFNLPCIHLHAEHQFSTGLMLSVGDIERDKSLFPTSGSTSTFEELNNYCGV